MKWFSLCFSALCFFCMVLLCGCANKTERQSDLLGLIKEPGQPSDMPLKVLIQKMNQATDPKQVFRRANTYRLVQRIVSKEEKSDALTNKKSSSLDEYEQELLYRKPNFLKQIASRNGNQFTILLFKENRAWVINPHTQKSVEIKGHRLKLTQAFLAISDPSKTPADVFPDIKLSVVYKDRKRFYRMVCRTGDPTIAPYVLYVDASTYLTTMAQTILYTDDGEEFLYTAKNQDFRWDDNVKIAYKSLITVGNKEDICTVEDFTINARLTDDTFDLPESKSLFSGKK